MADSGLYTTKHNRRPTWFDEFKNVDPDLAWNIIRKMIAVHVFEDASVVIPFLKDNYFYTTNSVVLKKGKNIIKRVLFEEKVSYQPAGKLLSLCTEITSACLENIQQPLKHEDLWYASDYRKLYEEKFDNVRKSIEITLTGMKKYKRSSNFSFENTIRLSQSTLASMLNILSPPNYVYLIHASYVAKRVKLVLRIDRNVKVYDKKNITIAFDLYRYDLLNDGMLQNPEYYIRPKLNKREFWTAALDVTWPEDIPSPRIFQTEFLAFKQDEDEEASNESDQDEQSEKDAKDELTF